MTMQSWPGAGQMYGFPPGFGLAGASANDQTLDATNEAVHLVGHCFLPAQTGSKTISAAGGGSIRWMAGAATNTFANAGSTIRLGIQDVSTATSPAQGDGTHDVYGDMVGGTYVVADATTNVTTMGTGTKTISHGDKIAVVFKMTARAGADTVRIRPATVSGASTSVAMQFPAVMFESSAASFTSVAGIPIVTIIFDDGTKGFIHGGLPISNTTNLQTSSSAFNTGSNPDEYATIFRLNAPVRINALWAMMLFANASADAELILYSDPLGTPAAVSGGTVTVDATQVSAFASARIVSGVLAAPIDLAANTDYAIAVRPTTANSVTVQYQDYAANGDMEGVAGGDDMYYGTRQNQTGAFSTTTTRRLWAGFFVSGSDDAAGGGGGGGPLIGGRLIL